MEKRIEERGLFWSKADNQFDYESQMVSLEAFVQDLEKGIVIFFYTKKDGSIRRAIGTRAPKYLPNQGERIRVDAFYSIEKTLANYEIEEKNFVKKYNNSRGHYATKEMLDVLEGIVAKVNYDDELEERRIEESKERKNPALLTYFDMGLLEWRSFNPNNLIMIAG